MWQRCVRAKREATRNRFLEAFVPCFRELADRSKTASGNTDVDVGMEGQLLAPCMEDRDDPGLRSKELRVGAQGEQRLLHTFKLQIKKNLQIRFFYQSIQFVWDCKIFRFCAAIRSADVRDQEIVRFIRKNGVAVGAVPAAGDMDAVL